MGISFKVFPGVRIGATRRGMNTSIGPRIARVHVNSSGVRWSSGAGPITVSGGGRGSRRSGSGTDQGIDLDAFDAAMQVPDELRQAKLDSEIEKHTKWGWKVEKHEGTKVSLKLKSPKLSFKGQIAFLIFFFAIFVTPTSFLAFSMGIWPGIIWLLSCVGVATFKTYFPDKYIYRQIEVGEWGVVHKKFHG